jgi:hypothetical protein
MAIGIGITLIVILLWCIAHSLSSMVHHLAAISAQLERDSDLLPDKIAEAVAQKLCWRIEEIHEKLTVIAHQGVR